MKKKESHNHRKEIGESAILDKEDEY